MYLSIQDEPKVTAGQGNFNHFCRPTSSEKESEHQYIVITGLYTLSSVKELVLEVPLLAQ